MKMHEIKTCPAFFQDAIDGLKTFTIRKDDRNYQVGDILRKKEYWEEYTGRQVDFEIVYKIADFDGIESGYCILGIKKLD